MAENWGMLENHFFDIGSDQESDGKCWKVSDVVLSVLGVIRGLWWKNCQFEESSEQSETTYEPAMISYWYCFFRYWEWSEDCDDNHEEIKWKCWSSVKIIWVEHALCLAKKCTALGKGLVKTKWKHGLTMKIF